MAVRDPGDGPDAPRPVTVLVLTPCIGGHFFGELVAGMSREVARAGGRIVLVQTLDGGIRVDEESEFSAFSAPVAWDEVDGVVSITTAVRAPYLQRVRDAGKPVVLASVRLPDFPAPSAVPDNGGGARAAVEHLLGHGHTKIGFVGNLTQTDIRERHAAYVDVLQSHGIAADPALVFPTDSNDFDAGARAAEQVLAAPTRPTAVLVATDRNAIGLMDALGAAGLVVPRDLAVVGFDNMEEAAFSSPPLSSVNQRFDQIGALAARLVLDQIHGVAVAVGPHTPPSAPLQLRGSCGCRTNALGTAAAGLGGGADETAGPSPTSLSQQLSAALRDCLLVGDRLDDPVSAAIAETVTGVDRLIHDGVHIDAADIQRLTVSLNRLTSRPNVLRRLTMLVMAHVQRAAVTPRADASAGATEPAGSWLLTAALWQMQVGAFLTQAEAARADLQEQYVVDARMLSVDHADLRRLDWLADTHVSAGMLALWEDGPQGRRLRIAGRYDPEGLVTGPIDPDTTAEQFPPEELVAAARVSGNVCIVVPICTKDRDWGLIAVLGKPDTASALQTYRHWANQLCASFEAEELQKSVRESEQRYAFAARASNDGLWEYNLKTGHVYLSERCMRMLDIESVEGQDRRALWRARVHPDDAEVVVTFNERISAGAQETETCEYRVRVGDGSYRWVLARAVGVQSAGDDVVERVVGSLSDVHERHCLEDQLRENALFDALTGLPNRRLFLSQLEQAVALWKRARTPFAVIFLDLDGFKAINDSLGHQMGDRVLNAVGSRIQHELRDVDTGARFGGDEFAILVANADHVGAFSLARRLQSALAQVIHLDDHEFSIGASMGVATSAIGYTSAEDVLRDADTAMYEAKENDRGSVSFFDSVMHAQALRELSLNRELRQALDQQQFEMAYQPIVNLTTGRIDRFEALVRWRHPVRGLVMPDDFLPAMSESGAIVQLGHWIIDMVCRQLADWGPTVANVALNVSDREFWHGDLLAHVRDALARYELGADRLTLEITEGVIMRRPDVAVRTMQDLHDAGIALHIDDFGTGNSSLETLHRFPVDAFKIDRSFIAELTTSERIEELVRAIVAMGSALKLDVVAEGVETRQQLEFLQQIGCASAQGFLFTAAVPPDQALATVGNVLLPNRSGRLKRPA